MCSYSLQTSGIVIAYRTALTAPEGHLVVLHAEEDEADDEAAAPWEPSEGKATFSVFELHLIVIRQFSCHQSWHNEH